jgi:hypothetical protein
MNYKYRYSLDIPSSMVEITVLEIKLPIEESED